MELGPLSDIASEPGVTDIAVTCDGTVWVDRGQGMRPYAMRAPFANPVQGFELSHGCHPYVLPSVCF